MLEMVDVRLRGRGRPRLDGVNLRLAPGVVYGLIGPNGAGKSSLMSVLARLVPASSGELSSPPTLVGAVLSENGLHPGRTVRETIRLRGSYARLGREVADDALRRAGLESVARRKVGALSLGMRIRLAIAAATIGEPGLLILDEPMNGLDPDGISWVRSVIADMRSRGVIVVVSSHLLSELAQFIDVAVIISAGTITRIESMRRVAQPGCLIRVNDPAALVDIFGLKGCCSTIRGEWVSVDLPAPEAVREAVTNSLDVFGVEERGTDLEDLYATTTTGEYLAGGAR
ncbi:ATP-binding cassette domain-containing protein [Curtobacterium sp. VKM Ac-1376]|uniref:ATP-binding cassette domain-containing protein n=1 Tax=Curtobacterium sp. VKM Ac-1376 TaxID=123312 RepID=UPI00188AA5B7|nr:ATP-binding cassette domain-containing protein [Curtobacterium sp. VKM Ac-1376]MBF4614284.1 ATP-binding cassette domain-containing protein [Curtobacterium sp. VKM Ac-1376]